MQIILSGKEFDEAMENYVTSLGFSTSKYTISTRTVVGRGDSPSTSVTITLEEKENAISVPSPSGTTWEEAYEEVTKPKRFGQGGAE